MSAAQPTGGHLGDLCSLYIDLTRDQGAIEAGDWVVTAAGSRYLVASAHRVEPHRAQNAQGIRWQMTVHRLPKNCDVPDDVRAIELRWYRR